MIRKWTAILLTLMLAFMLPLAAFAHTQHALSVELGDMLAGEPAVDELLKVLSLKVASGEKGGALTLALDGVDIATIGLGLDETALYAYSSELLGDDVLSVNLDDAFLFLKGMIAAEMAEEEIPGLGDLLDQLDEFKAQLQLALKNGVQVNTGVVSREESMAQVQQMLGDYPEMLAWIEGIYDRLIPENGEFAAEGRDTADQKYSLSLTNTDFLALMDTDYIHSILEKQIQAQDSTLDAAALKEATDSAIAEAKASFAEMVMVVDTNVYTLDEGKTTVGFDLSMSLIPEDVVDEHLMMTMNYARLTTEAGKSHKADFWMGDDVNEALSMKLDSVCATDGSCKGMVGLLASGEEVVFQFGSEEKADATESFASVFLRSNATAILEPAASDRPLITFRVSSCEVDSAAVDKLDNASLENSVDIMKMSSEQMEALVSGISGRAMQVAFTAMSKLPTSVLNLLMGEM